jgi:alditol oxidase
MKTLRWDTMKKRTFLKLMSSTLVRSTLPAATPNLTNWSGNLEYSTAHVVDATNENQIRSAVKAEAKGMRVLGTRHCFNTIADSRSALLNMKTQEEFIAVDKVEKTVTVNAGITYGRLAPILDKQGYALHNLASLPHISVAGSCSTGTHGSGERNGNLSTAVAGLEIITAGGDTLKLSRRQHPNIFTGAVVSLGALGVITKVTLDVRPSFTMRQYVYENMPTDQAMANFDVIQRTGYSVSLFTDWQKHRINEVWIKCVSGSQFPGPKEFFGGKLATKDLHPIAELGAENCTAQMGVVGPWYERLPHFRMGFTPSAGKELQSEYFVPRKNAVEAILAIERLKDHVSPHLMISEIRTIAADDLWLSPAYKRDSVALHFTWKQDWPNVQKVLPLIERELNPFGVRPHWGKLFTMKPRYERMADFAALCKQHDPHGKFHNDFVNQYVFA